MKYSTVVLVFFSNIMLAGQHDMNQKQFSLPLNQSKRPLKLTEVKNKLGALREMLSNKTALVFPTEQNARKLCSFEIEEKINFVEQMYKELASGLSKDDFDPLRFELLIYNIERMIKQLDCDKEIKELNNILKAFEVNTSKDQSIIQKVRNIWRVLGGLYVILNEFHGIELHPDNQAIFDYLEKNLLEYAFWDQDDAVYYKIKHFFKSEQNQQKLFFMINHMLDLLQNYYTGKALSYDRYLDSKKDSYESIDNRLLAGLLTVDQKLKDSLKWLIVEKAGINLLTNYLFHYSITMASSPFTNLYQLVNSFFDKSVCMRFFYKKYSDISEAKVVFDEAAINRYFFNLQPTTQETDLINNMVATVEDNALKLYSYWISENLHSSRKFFEIFLNMALKHKNIVSHFYPSEQSSERIMQHHIIDVYCSVIASTASESDKEFCFQLLLKFLEQSDTALDITNLMKLDDELKNKMVGGSVQTDRAEYSYSGNAVAEFTKYVDSHPNQMVTWLVFERTGQANYSQVLFSVWPTKLQQRYRSFVDKLEEAFGKVDLPEYCSQLTLEEFKSALFKKRDEVIVKFNQHVIFNFKKKKEFLTIFDNFIKAIDDSYEKKDTHFLSFDFKKLTAPFVEASVSGSLESKNLIKGYFDRGSIWGIKKSSASINTDDDSDETLKQGQRGAFSSSRKPSSYSKVPIVHNAGQKSLYHGGQKKGQTFLKQIPQSKSYLSDEQLHKETLEKKPVVKDTWWNRLTYRFGW
ncbi:hypothetical protein IPH25_04530 [bacterium]|nr:MAG: hypothetical protein IPG37_01525 [bacterium]QQR61709.1 MAG: hypothetical protein IPH25_04530 [bacterium]QQR62723.1 MAG: hypothetical protein IPH67_04905 [bacterium]